jgi:hypothetical protein
VSDPRDPRIQRTPRGGLQRPRSNAATGVPAGWPREVRPPGTPDWERTAVAWLLDLCPPDFRGHPVLARHPVALARVAGHHVAASIEGCHRILGGARAELGGPGGLAVGVVEQVIEAVETERARLLAARRAVDLVEHALRGKGFVPGL